MHIDETVGSRASTEDRGARPSGEVQDDWMAWFSGMPVCERLGLRATSVRHGGVTLVLDAAEWLLNPNGAVHGGIVLACADQALGAAAMTAVPVDVIPATATLTSDFLRPAFPPLTFEAVVGRAGRTLVFVSVTVRDRLGKVCNEVRGTLVADGSSRALGAGKSSPA